jgi:putative copper resistance protein D
MTLPPPWQITPVGVLAVAVGVAHEIGVRRLAVRQGPDHRRRTRRRSLVFTSGLVLLVLVVSGPLDRWAMRWLSVHMVTHVVEMFYLPPLLVVGAPWVPLVFALPVGARRRVLRAFYRPGSTARLRAAARFVTHPVTAIVLFNGVMVLWHVPAVFDWASWHDWAMNWLMAPSFVVTGVLFWRVILPSHPFPPRGTTGVQIAAIVVTAFEMLVLAMALSIFTAAPWYSMNVVMEGPAAALRDQHWAAGILWVCGDFWAVPALVLVALRVNRREGGLSAPLERALGRV